MIFGRRRHPSGTSVGGQWAPGAAGEVEADLAPTPGPDFDTFDAELRAGGMPSFDLDHGLEEHEADALARSLGEVYLAESNLDEAHGVMTDAAKLPEGPLRRRLLGKPREMLMDERSKLTTDLARERFDREALKPSLAKDELDKAQYRLKSAQEGLRIDMKPVVRMREWQG